MSSRENGKPGGRRRESSRAELSQLRLIVSLFWTPLLCLSSRPNHNPILPFSLSSLISRLGTPTLSFPLPPSSSPSTTPVLRSLTPKSKGGPRSFHISTRNARPFFPPFPASSFHPLPPPSTTSTMHGHGRMRNARKRLVPKGFQYYYTPSE